LWYIPFFPFDLILQEQRKQRRRERGGARKHSKEDDRGTPGLKHFFFVVHLKLTLLFSRRAHPPPENDFPDRVNRRLELVVII